MPWNVTPADVLATTGATVTTESVAVADGMVTIYVNRTSEASASMSARDLGWIRQAIAWQAPWAAAQPDLTTRSQFDSLSQDGLSVQTAAEWAKLLHPMAARALKNLSWKASRTQRTPNASVPVGLGLDFAMEQSDRFSDWTPL